MDPDFSVITNGNRLLTVEVKGTPKADKQWAAKLRRNLLEHHAVPDAPYFLLVLPEHFYLWVNAKGNGEVPPNFEADTKKVLKKYLSRWSQDRHTHHLSEPGLELAVWSWLNDLTNPGYSQKLEDPEDQWLKDSGLAEKVKTGTVLQGTMP